jgi:hypothetical protein
MTLQEIENLIRERYTGRQPLALQVEVDDHGKWTAHDNPPLKDFADKRSFVEAYARTLREHPIVLVD